MYELATAPSANPCLQGEGAAPYVLLHRSCTVLAAGNNHWHWGSQRLSSGGDSPSVARFDLSHLCGHILLPPRGLERGISRTCLLSCVIIALFALVFSSGLVWITVFRQTWPFLWSKGQGLSLNVSNPMADNFSILDCLEGCRGSDGLFWLLYRDVGHGGQYVMWQQSSNPATTGGAVNDFQGLCWGPNPQEQATDAPTSFRGMSLSARACLMSGNGESDEPWYVVGAFQDHNGGIPALKQAQETMSSQAELLVAIQPDALPNLMSTIKARLEPSEEVSSSGQVCRLALRSVS